VGRRFIRTACTTSSPRRKEMVSAERLVYTALVYRRLLPASLCPPVVFMRLRTVRRARVIVRASLLAAGLAAAHAGTGPLLAQRGGRGPVTKPDYSAPADAPYTAEEVTVLTPAGHTLAGTLTLPKSASRQHRVGAIVTITGSGPQERDESIGLDGYHPFRQYADSLARRGIAMLRMDDRGTSASTGTFRRATSADFAEDIRAGLAYLRTRPEIDSTKLGLLGHSEGALIAPMVAEKEPGLRALVLLAGVARPARGVLVFQMTNIINHTDSLTTAQKESAIAAIPGRIDTMMAADPWMHFFLKYDPSATARLITSPAVLILTGANDQQADPMQVAEWAAAFKSAGNRDVTATVLPGLNHLFVPDTDGFPGHYAKLPPPVVVPPSVIGTVVDWLAQRFK
jgi:dipeptidyl aminopeptidase/acylaminoacyl peptidase